MNKVAQTIGLGVGCILLLLAPLVAIVAVWGFDLDSLKSFPTEIFSVNNNAEYGDNLTPGEDDLLTSFTKEQAQQSTAKSVANPAIKLKIAAANIDGPIVYGTDGEKLLREGFFHFPTTVLPGQKGVGVIFGHRRYHLPPHTDTFYNLDKVKVGDSVEVKLSDGTLLEFTVTKSEVISPDQLDSIITENSDKYILKLITCTPLGTNLQRLVVTCERIV